MPCNPSVRSAYSLLTPMPCYAIPHHARQTFFIHTCSFPTSPSSHFSSRYVSFFHNFQNKYTSVVVRLPINSFVCLLILYLFYSHSYNLLLLQRNHPTPYVQFYAIPTRTCYLGRRNPTLSLLTPYIVYFKTWLSNILSIKLISISTSMVLLFVPWLLTTFVTENHQHFISHSHSNHYVDGQMQAVLQPQRSTIECVCLLATFITSCPIIRFSNTHYTKQCHLTLQRVHVHCRSHFFHLAHSFNHSSSLQV